MTLGQWLPLALLCLLGAMSPGPSLAVVTRHALAGGTHAGVICAVSHGFGIFLWAALMMSGLGAMLLAQPTWFDGLRALGAMFLLYLGSRAFFSRRRVPPSSVSQVIDEGSKAFWEGFFIALSNPKVAVFFAALFSQFIQADATLTTQAIIAVTAAAVDALWYTVVAVLLSKPLWSDRLARHGDLLDRGFGAILMGLSVAVLWSLW